MPTTTRTDRVDVADGRFDLHVWLPEGGSGPGVLLLQEIFGVGPYITAVAERLAGLGYVVGAPDVFWRIQPGWVSGHDEAGLAASMDVVKRFDVPTAVHDCVVALARLEELPEVQGRAGVLGFCLGGTLAHLVGGAAEPAFVISYYGSGVPGTLSVLDAIGCPAIYHFGGEDAFIPRDQIDAVVAAGEERTDVDVYVYDAGHAFDNHESAMFHEPKAAASAWERTVAFLRRHSPV